jgi:uncharacterized protein
MSPKPLLRVFMLACAVLCLGLGVLGVFVPGLPTTPFILLAAACAARGSPRLLAWLEAHKVFGPMIIHWRAHGAVARRAKWLATVTMGLCALLLWWAAKLWWVAALGSSTMAIVLVWLWLRPEPQVAAAPVGQAAPTTHH